MALAMTELPLQTQGQDVALLDKNEPRYLKLSRVTKKTKIWDGQWYMNERRANDLSSW